MESTTLVKTPHPVTLEGQEHIYVELRPGESLFALLERSLGDQLDGEMWNVTVAGVDIPRENWFHCFPKHGQLIEVRGDVGKTALLIVAMIALTIFTAGAFAAIAAGGTIAGLGTMASYAVIAGVQVVGSLLINKVLGPKAPGNEADSSQGTQRFALSSSQNSARLYGAVPICFGSPRVAADLLSKTYNYFDRDEMYLAMHLSWGIGVGRIEQLMNGDTPLSSFDDAVQQWNSGFSAMPEQVIPLFGNVDTQPGGSLQQEIDGVTTLLDVIRTTSVNTVRIQVDVSGTLYDANSKGKLINNQEGMQLWYRPVGASSWIFADVRTLINDNRSQLRFTMFVDVTEGQYEVRVRRTGQDTDGDNAVCTFTVDSISSIQKDTSDYDGLARTGLTLRATNRLAGSPSELRAQAHASAIPVWTLDDGWVTQETSNPGAHMLKYMRGYYSPKGKLIAGMGLADADIDIPAFQAFMLHCELYGFTYDYWLTEERDHLTVLDTIAAAGLGQYTDANGLLSVVWVAEDQPIDGTINMARIKKGTFKVDYSLVATADGVSARYWDKTKQAEATLRVPMPGVTTILNPASIDLEGVLTEDQAAFMARYYLAQSLYQYKDVTFGTNLENLTYRRLSLLQMQHDMTQWGYGGVVEAFAVDNLGRGILTLDEPVPAPDPGKQAYIGVRVPGQRTASVMRVLPFTGESNVLSLMDPWPADLPRPGNTPENPAHDSIWIYDFKETPGLTVRVVNIARASDKSASVSVVQESDEFWTYVKTGEYIPADSGSLLRTRPVASNLVITENSQIIGDVIQDQLTVQFQIDGPYERSVIFLANSDGTLSPVAETTTRSATFNIPGQGSYTISVVPYSPAGLRGTAVTVIYNTSLAGAPPVLVDFFDVEQLSGGIRFYSWGFYADTIQSADYAGVEIRYNTGTTQLPWDQMTPLGDDGYHTAPFEAIVPTSGTYTFACRSRNTSGILSVDARVIVKELGRNLSEELEKMREDSERDFENINADLNELVQQLSDEAAARAAADLEEANTRQGQVDQLTADIGAQADALLNEQLAREAAITLEAQTRQSEDESLALQISSIVAGTGQQFDSKAIWYFDNGNEGWTGSAADGFLNPGTALAQSPTGLAVLGSQYRYLKMRVRRMGAPAWAGQVSWTLTDATTGTAPLAEPVWDTEGWATIDLSDIPWADGTVDRIGVRLSTAVDGTNYYLYDWIAIGRPTPGASVAMVQEETMARINGDAAEASQRNTLAVQLRGSYEGTDVASLTQGLVYSERVARTTADGVLAQDITSLQVRAGNIESSVTTETSARIAGDETNAQQITVLTSQLAGKADASALTALDTRVTQTETGLQAVSTSVLSLNAQLVGTHAGDTDTYAGDPDVRAGTLTTYTAIASGDQALAQRIDLLNAEFGNYQSTINAQLLVVSNAQSTQALAITDLQSQMAGKASAQAVSILQTQVDQQASLITTNAQAITQVNTRVDGKAEASVVQQLQVSTTATSNTVVAINARYFLGVEVNGLVGGMYVGNNGTLVNVRFRADRFTIESPTGTGERFEYSNNSIKIYDAGNVRRVELGLLS